MYQDRKISYSIAFGIIAIIFIPLCALAQMQALPDDELSQINAGIGINLRINCGIAFPGFTATGIRIQGDKDTDPFKIGIKPGVDLGGAYLDLPMEGSLHIEDTVFDGSDLGPCAVEGIKVHYFKVRPPK